MRRTHRFTAALALLALAAPLAAQSTVAPGPSPRSDSRVKVGIVLPLGNVGTRAEHAPRVEAWGERVRRTQAGGDSAGSGQPATFNRIGVAVTQQPRLLVNGREIPQQPSQHNVSAIGWAGIGLGVLAVGLGLGLLGVFGRTE